MSEKSTSAESASGTGVDASAVALGLAGASRDKADAFLDDQRRMIHLQMEEMRQRNPYEISHFRLRRFSGWAKAVFELSVGLLVLALVAGISLMVWNAAHSDGLVIESFTVPPDMAAKGLTGQVIAGKTLDELIAIQNANRTSRAAKSFANNWGDDLKVEIPDTGVSVGEVFRFLKTWLGHETHISGEVTRTASGIAITARVSGETGATVAGSETELDALVHKAAENIYRVTQPYRYGVYLQSNGRKDEAIVIFKALATGGPAQERPWGYIGWSNTLLDTAGRGVSLGLLQKALALQPYNVLALNNLENTISGAGREEEAFHLNARTLAAFDRDPSATINPAQLGGLRLRAEGIHARLLGDWRQAARRIREGMEFGLVNVGSASYPMAEAETHSHDLAAARAAMADPFPSANIAPGLNAFSAISARIVMRLEAGDWTGVLADARNLDPVMRQYPGTRVLYNTQYVPLIAEAQARLGHFATAEALIAPTPDGCAPCLRARGWIAAMHGQHARADFWFARSASAAPSIPFANAEWGQALLDQDKPDEAIEKFKLANQKGPHFADALEGWGEALMAKNQSHLALEKFKDAEKYAPNWGRLHLKWGEALLYSGKPADAKVQFARAAALDLTPSEKAELAKVNHG